MKFTQIVILDYLTFTDRALEELQTYSEKEIKVFADDPTDNAETISRIGNADCVLVSWRTSLGSEVLSQCKNLRYVGVCATSVGKIDLNYCGSKEIMVSNVRDYGDEGVVEWIIYELLSLVRGYGEYQWRKDKVHELSGKTLGVIGLGVVGKMLCNAALGLGMKVLYYSRTRNEDFESKGCQFVSKEELLKQSDFISLHTPRDLKILSSEDFALMKDTVLINTVVGEAFLKQDFLEWISSGRNFAMMDVCVSKSFFDSFGSLDKVTIREFVSGRTEECFERLSKKSIVNVQNFLSGQTEHKIQ